MKRRIIMIEITAIPTGGTMVRFYRKGAETKVYNPKWNSLMRLEKIIRTLYYYRPALVEISPFVKGMMIYPIYPLNIKDFCISPPNGDANRRPAIADCPQ